MARDGDHKVDSIRKTSLNDRLKVRVVLLLIVVFSLEHAVHQVRSNVNRSHSQLFHLKCAALENKAPHRFHANNHNIHPNHPITQFIYRSKEQKSGNSFYSTSSNRLRPLNTPCPGTPPRFLYASSTGISASRFRYSFFRKPNFVWDLFAAFRNTLQPRMEPAFATQHPAASKIVLSELSFVAPAGISSHWIFA